MFYYYDCIITVPFCSVLYVVLIICIASNDSRAILIQTIVEQFWFRW